MTQAHDDTIAPGMAGRGKALATLILGVLGFIGSFVFIGIVASVAAVVVGFLALRHIASEQALTGTNPEAEKAYGRSRLFVYLGYIGAALGMAGFLFMMWVTSLYSEGLTKCAQQHGDNSAAAGQCAQQYVMDRLLP